VVFKLFGSRHPERDQNFFAAHASKFRYKNCNISSCRKNFAAPFKFLTAPQSAAAHSLKTTVMAQDWHPNWYLDRIWKKNQKFRLFGPFFVKNCIYARNIGKSLSFDPKLGRRNLLLGHGLATPALDYHQKKFGKFLSFFLNNFQTLLNDSKKF
jgi:hypothetical protein